MQINRIRWGGFLSLIVCSLLPSCLPVGVHHPASAYSKMSASIIAQYKKEVVKPRGVHINGRGGAMLDDVEWIDLSFSAYEKLDVDEARVLYVEMMEELLARYNRDQEIRPYLHNYPFETHNVKMVLSFDDEKNQALADGHVALVSVRDNTLYFAAYDSQKGKFYLIHEEPYTDSLKIVNALASRE